MCGKQKCIPIYQERRLEGTLIYTYVNVNNYIKAMQIYYAADLNITPLNREI